MIEAENEAGGKSELSTIRTTGQSVSSLVICDTILYSFSLHLRTKTCVLYPAKRPSLEDNERGHYEIAFLYQQEMVCICTRP